MSNDLFIWNEPTYSRYDIVLRESAPVTSTPTRGGGYYSPRSKPKPHPPRRYAYGWGNVPHPEGTGTVHATGALDLTPDWRGQVWPVDDDEVVAILLGLPELLDP